MLAGAVVQWQAGRSLDSTLWRHHFLIWASTVSFGPYWFLVLSNYLDKGWKLDQWCNGKQVDKQLVEPPFPYMGIKASRVIPVL